MGVKVRFHRGEWWLFIAHRGRRRSKKIGDRTTAMQVAKGVRERLQLGDLALLGTDSETFEIYSTRWLEDGKAGRKNSTDRFYRFNITLHIVPVLRGRPVGGITRADCRAVLAACRAKGLKTASLQGVQRTLSAVLSQAVEDGLLEANPAFRMGKYTRQGDEARSEIQPLTREEAYQFLVSVQKSHPEHYALFLCALRTGMRLGELLGLQWADINLVTKSIEIRRALVSGHLTTPKNGKRRRVDMSANLTETLERRLVSVKAAALQAGKAMPQWVFTNGEGNPLDGDNLRERIFHPALTKAKLRRIRLHDLRHTFASLLIQQGESLAYVKEQMGHSSIQVTVDIYGHLVPGSNRSAVDRLDAHPTCIPAASEG